MYSGVAMIKKIQALMRSCAWVLTTPALGLGRLPVMACKAWTMVVWVWGDKLFAVSYKA